MLVGIYVFALYIPLLFITNHLHIIKWLIKMIGMFFSFIHIYIYVHIYIYIKKKHDIHDRLINYIRWDFLMMLCHTCH